MQAPRRLDAARRKWHPARMDVVTAEIAHFLDGLREAASATRFLEAWCARRGLGAGPVRSRRLPPPAPDAGAEALLAPHPWERPEARRVTLMRGTEALSDCEIRWVGTRLTPAMREALARTDTPFGVVVAPLGPERRLLAERVLPAGGEHALDCTALVVAGGRPIAVARERYRRALFG